MCAFHKGARLRRSTPPKAPAKAALVMPGTKEGKKGKKGKDDTTKATAGAGDEALLSSVVGVEADEIEEDYDIVDVFKFNDTTVEVRPSFTLTTSHAHRCVCISIQAEKKRCNELEYLMLDEYAFRNDTVNANLEIDPKARDLR